MATKAEAAHAEAEKKPTKPAKKRKLAQRKTAAEKHTHHEPKAAAKKATRAAEPAPAKGKRPTRKSTRKSANRAKADASMNIHSENAKNSPTSRARSAKSKAVTVKGKSRKKA